MEYLQFPNSKCFNCDPMIWIKTTNSKNQLAHLFAELSSVKCQNHFNQREVKIVWLLWNLLNMVCKLNRVTKIALIDSRAWWRLENAIKHQLYCQCQHYTLRSAGSITDVAMSEPQCPGNKMIQDHKIDALGLVLKNFTD